MKQTVFEQMNGTYTQQGDYLIPCLTLHDEEKVEIGLWGQRHLRYLKQSHKVLYYNLLDVVCTSLCKWRRTTRYNCLQKKKKRNRKLKFHNLKNYLSRLFTSNRRDKILPRKNSIFTFRRKTSQKY